MPSLRAQLAHWAVWYKFRVPRHATESQLLENIRRSWADADLATPAPTGIESSSKFDLSREEVKLPAGQTWTVDHVHRKGGERGPDKVIVFWHGGAFIRKAQPPHWDFVAHLVETTGIPAIIPHYTLAPLSTATHATLAGIQFIIDLQNDPRYADKEVVLMGDSAGGWFVAQMLMVLTKLALGEKINLVGEDELQRVEVVKGVRRKMKVAVLISPALEMDTGSIENPEDEEVQPNDSWLNYKQALIFGQLWGKGPSHATPSVSYDFPSDAPVVSAKKYTLDPDVSIIDERINPTRAAEVLQRYAQQNAGGATKGIRVFQMCGTSDILHPQALRFDKKLHRFGTNVVRPELIVEPGLFHVYPLVQSTPEAQKAISRIKALLLEDD